MNTLKSCIRTSAYLLATFGFAYALFFPQITFAADPDLFIIEVDTNQSGITPMSFHIPTTGGGYNYQVDCDYDGITFTPTISGQTGNYTCVYGVNGIYDVAIRGTFPRIYFNISGDNLKLKDIKQWGTSQWTSFNNAFSGATQMTITATDIPDLSNVTDTSMMFFQADSLFPYPLLSTWDMSTVTNVSYMFAGSNFFNEDISGWDTSAMTNMSGLFQSTPFNQDISGWDTSNVTKMTNMFSDTPFNQDISGWDTSNVEYFDGMFAGTLFFNQNIGGWNTSSAINMDSMFSYSHVFNQDISNWDVSNVSSVLYMFSNTQAFNQDLNGWDTSGFTDVTGMFSEAQVFNSNISAWDTSNVTNMSFMFELAPSFNQDISNWNTSNVTQMGGMFYAATSFNQDISNWNTSNTTSFYGMFEGATSFDQNLGAWNVTSLTDALNMFNGTGLSPFNYESLLVGWGGQTVAPNVVFNAGNSQYCTSSAQTARNTLTSVPYSWIITDGGIGGCYDVTYNGNGNTGGVPPITQNSVAGSSLVVQNQGTLVKNGYTFAGWNTMANGAGISYSAGSTLLVPSSNVQLYAKWILNTSGGSGGSRKIIDRVTPVIEPFGASEPILFKCEQAVTIESPIVLGEKDTSLKTISVIQTFLNNTQNEKLKVTGVYDVPTQNAINRFQLKYKDSILTPWGLEKPTGVIFKTTTRKINILSCLQQKTCPLFTKKLSIGESHQEVQYLKSLLNTMLDVSLDVDSMLYDEATKKAVTEFQKIYKNTILAPLGLSEPTGRWYEFTIRQANTILGC